MRVASVQQVKELFSFLPFPLLIGNRCFSINILYPEFWVISEICPDKPLTVVLRWKRFQIIIKC